MGGGSRTKRCSDTIRAGRLAKARQFWEAAEVIADSTTDDDLIDAHVMLCVNAGIAAADALCCARLGEHAQGQDHREAVDLLAKVDPKLARHLSTLLGSKTKAAYSEVSASSINRRKVERAAATLVRAATDAA